MNENSNDNMDQAAGHISVNSQYLKDLSFENPNAPYSIGALTEAPEVDIALDVNVTKLEEIDTYEVSLKIETKAVNPKDSKIVFVVDLEYAGIFTLQNIPNDQKTILLGVHCPAMLFPFARKILASVTQDGGYQPLMIDPIDFGALFQKKMLEEQAAEGKA